MTFTDIPEMKARQLVVQDSMTDSTVCTHLPARLAWT